MIHCRLHPDQIIAMSIDGRFCRCPSLDDCCLESQTKEAGDVVETVAAAPAAEMETYK